MRIYCTIISITILLCCFFRSGIAQSQCYTKEQLPKKIKPKSFPYPDALEKDGEGTWSVFDSYGGSCVQNCDLTTAFRMPSVQACDNDPCGNGVGVYLVPIKVTVFADAFNGGDATNPANYTNPALTDLSDIEGQINAMNAFHCCQGVPIQFYQIAGSPFILVDADLNDFNNRGLSTTSADDETDDSALPFQTDSYLDLFIASDLNQTTDNGSGCNGFADLPFGQSFSRTVMSAKCIAGSTIADPCADPEEGIVLFHEIGHILGLYHTHETDFNNDTTTESDDPNVGTDDCSSGDLIADTDEDPDYSGEEIGFTGCVTGGNTSNCAFNNAADPNCSPYGNPNTIDNVMSYNNFGGCRNSYTSCQKARMVDALCGRTSWCDPDMSRYFANVTDANIEICVGDPIPSFNPSLRSCVQWYDAATGGNNIGNGAPFTPSAGLVDVSTPGTYTIYFEDTNDYSDCRKEVTVKVFSNPGVAMNNTMCIDGSANLAIGNTTTAVSGEQIVGYYFSDSDPTSTTTPAAITAAINGATNGNALNVGTGNVIQADNGTPQTELSGLNIDCAALGGDGEYYLTPFVAQGDPPISCSATVNNTSFTWSNGAGGASFLLGPLGCTPGSTYSLIDYEIVITVTSCSNTGNPIGLDVRPSCGGLGTPFDATLTCSAGTTFTISKAIIDAAVGAGFDPLTDQVCIAMINSNFAGTLSFVGTATLNATYEGQDAITQWNTNSSPTIDANNNSCFWGTPLKIVCDNLAVSATSTCVDMTGEVSITIAGGTSDYTVSGIVSGMLPASGNLSGAAGSGDLTVTDANGCTETIPVVVDAGCAVVPVELVAFKGTYRGGKNFLNWRTATEFENDYFLVERSQDGQKFEAIGKVDGSGTTIETQTYEFIDALPKENLNYYRLQQVDFDGTYEYSSIIVIRQGKEQFVAEVFPSPTSTFLNVSANKAVNTIQVIDITGRLVLSSTYDYINTVRLDVSKLTTGTYFVSIKSDEEVELVRFVKD